MKDTTEQKKKKVNQRLDKLYRLFNDITKRQKINSNFPQKLKVNDQFLTNPVEIVKNFNLYFSTIWKQTSLNSNASKNYFINSPRNYNSSFAWFEVQEKEIVDIIKSLDSNKANGDDNICYLMTVRVLKLINSHIAKIISILINLAF